VRYKITDLGVNRLPGFVAERAAERPGPFRSAEDVAGFMKDRLVATDREVFYVLILDSQNRLIAEEPVSVGTLTASLVHPREVFAPALVRRGAAIIVVHNHPSGNPEPSEEDRTITTRLLDAGSILGIALLDHVILGGEGRYTSLAADIRMRKGGSRAS